jgi:hypothetical protein
MTRAQDLYSVRRKDGVAVIQARLYADAQAAMSDRRKDKGFPREERVGLYLTVGKADQS